MILEKIANRLEAERSLASHLPQKGSMKMPTLSDTHGADRNSERKSLKEMDVTQRI
jgi:hypothetical protein